MPCPLLFFFQDITSQFWVLRCSTICAASGVAKDGRAERETETKTERTALLPEHTGDQLSAAEGSLLVAL